MTKHKSKKLDYTPHFHEAAADILNKNNKPFISILGVPSTPEHFDANMTYSGRQTYFNIEKFRQEHQAEIDKFNEEYDDEIILSEEINEEWDNQVFLTEETGEQLAIRIVNRGDKPTIVMFSTWSTDSSWQNTKGIIEAMALTMPEYQIVYVDTPGMGKSSKVTGQRMRTMKETGSFMPLAEQVVGCLRGSHFDISVVCGISEGAREAIAVGAELGNVDIVTMDSPGTTELSATEIVKGFSIVEGGRQKKVMSMSPDTKMVEAHKKNDQIKIVPEIARAALKRNRLLARVIAMRRKGLKTDVEKAVQRGSRILEYRFESSAVGDAEEARKLSTQIDNYETLILQDAPHSITETNPYAVAALIKSGIELRDTDSI